MIFINYNYLLKFTFFDLPQKKDWRKNGKVSPVQDQGRCGSCYAFATVANCESFKAIKENYMPKYSVQELIGMLYRY